MSLSNVNKAVVPMFIQRNTEWVFSMKYKISGDYIPLNEAAIRLVIQDENGADALVFENDAFAVIDSYTRQLTITPAQSDGLNDEQVYSYDLKIVRNGKNEYIMEGPVTPSKRRS